MHNSTRSPKVLDKRFAQLHQYRQSSSDDTDYTDSEDFDPSRRPSSLKDNSTLVKIKLAAIYDKEADIVEILSNETSSDSVQSLLSEKDERDQPCIFYALESRSKNALNYLLSVVKHTDCLMAANGETVLHAATKLGDIEILKRLLTEELVVNLVDNVETENGKTALHLAAQFNHVEIAKELLLHQARVDKEDNEGKTPILTAASKGYASMLKTFFQYGRESIENLMLNLRFYGKHYDNLLQVAVDSGDEKTVHVCLDQDPEIVCKCLQKEIKHGGGGLLHSACRNGMKECLLKIVDSVGGLDKLDLNKNDKFGFTPFHKAAVNNHVDLVKYLGSNLKTVVDQITNYSQTALVLAAERGHVEIVEELLNLGADFGVTDESGRTVLHYAVQYPNILKMLLKKENLAQLLVNAKEKDGYTPVHNAALNGLCESLKVLLEYGGNMHVFTNTSRTPLHHAVTSQSLDVVQLVLSYQPSLANRADSTGKTPLHTASNHGNIDIVKCLLDHGALIARDGSLKSALHIAAHRGHLEVVKLLVSFNRNIIDWTNKRNRTALIVAASTGKTEVVKFLLDNGAAITKDVEFFNCLDWCCIKNDKETAMAMMRHPRWKEILMTASHGPEGTLAKLIDKMPGVAYRVLSNCETSNGHPDTKEYMKSYDFFCLQSSSEVVQKSGIEPMTAIKTMVETECYSCLCHPVCCKFLKAKWIDFGWKVHTANLLLYIAFLIAVNVYAFGIPSYHENKVNRGNSIASIHVSASMGICFFFVAVNGLKEIIQLIFQRFRYFLDPVNYLDCAMYACVIAFATPVNREITVKTSLQWKACSVALLLAWIKFVLHLRRFANYGIYVSMIRRICITLVKVVSLLIFFVVAFGAAFAPIMNGIEGFTDFGLSIFTAATMSMGELDFKETFLQDTNSTFFRLRLALLVPFILLMPIVLMNFLLALAVDDTSSIMQQAKLRKHIQTAKMIIEVETKRFWFPWCKTPKKVDALEEHPNKPVSFHTTVWEYFFCGPGFASDEDEEDAREQPAINKNVDQKLVVIVDTMKDMQKQMNTMQQKMVEIHEGAMFPGNHADQTAPARNVTEERQNVLTSFNEHTKSFEGIWSDINNTGIQSKRSVFTQSCGSYHESVSHFGSAYTEGTSRDVLTQQDVTDRKGEEEWEFDPVLMELKDMYKKTLLVKYRGINSTWQRLSRRREKAQRNVLRD